VADDVIAVLDHNRQLLAQLLAERLPQVGYAQPQASYLAWLDLRALELGEDPALARSSSAAGGAEPGPSFGRQGAGLRGSTSGLRRRWSKRRSSGLRA